MKSNAQLLLLTSEFPPLPGGIGNHALHLAMSLHKNGKNISVITNQRSIGDQHELNFDNQLPFSVLRIKRQKIVLFTYLNRILQTVSFVNKHQPMTLICSGKFSMWLGGFLKFFFSNLNSIAILHGSEINAGGAISKKISTWSLSRFNKIIAVSNFTKGLALEKNANLEITVINNGFSFPKADQNISSTTIAGNPAVVSVGNVTDRKGQLNVIKALPYLKEKFSEIHYHIIGIPTEKEKFETVAKTLGVFENVTFHGILSAAAMYQIVAQSKVFFMLSNSLKNGDVEGFGIAVLEANFLGLPAIGSLNTGIADAIKDGFSGKLVSPYDTSEIVAAFDAIMSNYDHYSAGAKQWCTKFDWEIIIKKYLEIIE